MKVLLLASASFALIAGAASAQSTAPAAAPTSKPAAAQTPATAGASTISETEVAAVAKIGAEAKRLQEAAAPGIAAAASAEDKRKAQYALDDQLEALFKTNGITFERYNAIASQAQSDKALAARIAAANASSSSSTAASSASSSTSPASATASDDSRTEPAKPGPGLTTSPEAGAAKPPAPATPDAPAQ